MICLIAFNFYNYIIWLLIFTNQSWKTLLTTIVATTAPDSDQGILRIMKENHAAENALATIGAVLWMIQNIPQVIKSYREKSTKGLSASLMLWVHMFICYSHHLQTGTDQKQKKSIWAVGTVIHGAYIVAQNFSIPLQVQPQVFAALATVSWCQCMYYGRGYSLKTVLAIFIVLCCIFAGFEVGSVYALWVRFNRINLFRLNGICWHLGGDKAGQRNGVEWPVLLYGYLSAVLLAVGLLWVILINVLSIRETPADE